MFKLKHRSVVGAIALVAAMAAPVAAQEFPNRPVKLVVAFGPGAVLDLVARGIAPGMSRALGQAVVVENKPGAAGLIAYEYIAKQVPADGYNLLIGNPSLASLPVFNKGLRFDPIADLPPISILVEAEQMMATPAGAPWQTFEELIRYAKANPGKVNAAVPGMQSPQTLFVEALKHKYGVDIGIIPFSGGGGQIRPEVVSNRVQFAFYTESMTVADGNKVRLLATSGEKRLQGFPTVPTFSEVGNPEFGGFWISLNGVRNTPKPIVDKIYAAARSTLQLPEVKDPFAKLGLVAIALVPEASAERISAEAKFSYEVAKKAGIQPQ